MIQVVTIRAYLDMENPVYISPDTNGTFLEFEDGYDEEAGTYYDASGKFVDFVEALNFVAEDYDWLGSFSFDFLYEYAYDDMGMYASKMFSVLRKSRYDEKFLNFNAQADFFHRRCMWILRGEKIGLRVKFRNRYD